MAGIFGTCQASENAQAIDRRFDMSEQIVSTVQHLKNATDQKFFIGSKELRAKSDIQNKCRTFKMLTGNSYWNRFSRIKYMKCPIVISSYTLDKKLILTSIKLHQFFRYTIRTLKPIEPRSLPIISIC